MYWSPDEEDQGRGYAEPLPFFNAQTPFNRQSETIWLLSLLFAFPLLLAFEIVVFFSKVYKINFIGDISTLFNFTIIKKNCSIIKGLH